MKGVGEDKGREKYFSLQRVGEGKKGTKKRKDSKLPELR